MGDGTSCKNSGITLCTDSFSIEDIVRLMNVLILRYDLKCSTHTPREVSKYNLYI